MIRSLCHTNEPLPGLKDHTSITLSPLDRERLERAAQRIRLRGDSVRILLKWKTARRLQKRGPEQEQRRAA